MAGRRAKKKKDLLRTYNPDNALSAQIGQHGQDGIWRLLRRHTKRAIDVEQHQSLAVGPLGDA